MRDKEIWPFQSIEVNFATSPGVILVELVVVGGTKCPISKNWHD
jgi:hypothetical protein